MFFCGGGFAHATDDTKPGQQTTRTSTPENGAGDNAADDDNLSWHGITLFGTIDVGVVNQTRGAPINRDSAQGLNYTIGKASRKPMTTLAPNGLTPTTIGLKGKFEIANETFAIFRLEAGFDPLTLRLANGPQSLVDNNGRSVATQSASSDSNQAGQILNTAGFAGLGSNRYGTLTFGRQNGLLADRIIEYDPNGASYAFSVAGGASAVRGIGVAQGARLNSSLKYFNQAGPLRFGAQYQFSGTQHSLFSADGASGSAREIDLGGDYGSFSADFLYSQKHGAISATSLTAAQMLTNPSESLAATVSDNTSHTVLGRYAFDKAKFYAGYERIRFANPSSPLPAGTQDVGGYTLSVLTQNAYTNNRILNVYWAGIKYSPTPKLSMTGTYYAYSQNSYATDKSSGCSNDTSSACAGTLDAISLTGVYNLFKHLDLYAGIMRSAVRNGLASGYLYRSNVNTMIGGRFIF